MRSHERRLKRLEHQEANQNCEQLQIIRVYVDMKRQPVGAMLAGTDIGIEREPGESVEVFERRVDALCLDA
jgi:hypothetical protein